MLGRLPPRQTPRRVAIWAIGWLDKVGAVFSRALSLIHGEALGKGASLPQLPRLENEERFPAFAGAALTRSQLSP